MNRFEIVTPADLPSAVRLLAQPGHMALAGGVDTLDLLKQQIARAARAGRSEWARGTPGNRSGARRRLARRCARAP
jgi:hypothetical protein